MLNEVDRVILDSFVECSYCGSKSVVYIGTTTTLAACCPFIDSEGKSHTHDHNNVQTTYKCDNGHKFTIQVLNSCWCGWRQNA